MIRVLVFLYYNFCLLLLLLGSVSASVLPWVDKDARVEHRVDVGTERVLLLEVRLVDWAWTVHTKALETNERLGIKGGSEAVLI